MSIDPATMNRRVVIERYTVIPGPLNDEWVWSDIRTVWAAMKYDRADEEFEAFLLELLADWQVSIPELGTVTAKSVPLVVLTSNGTRELSDALRRRCLYHYVDYPDAEREARIVMARIPEAGAALSLQIARMVEKIRSEDLRKVPGVAETLDWAAALVGLDVKDLHDAPEAVHETMMCLLKTREDAARMTREVTERLLGKVA